MIYKWLREDLAKLSYISEVKFTGTYVYLHYGEDKVKKLAYRANKIMVLNTLDEIREELGLNNKVTEMKENKFTVVYSGDTDE